MSISYLIEQITPEKHKENLVKFWANNLATNFNQRYDWFYSDHSFGVPKTWILTQKGSLDILGCASLFPRKFRIKKQNYLAGINCDFFIDKNHRTLGPALKLLHAVTDDYQQHGLDFLLAFPNEKAGPVFKRCGYVELAPLYRWAKPLRTQNYIARKHPNSKAAIALSFPLDFLLKNFRKLKGRRTLQSVDLKVIEHLPENLHFQNGGSAHLSHATFSPSFLAWRYLSNPKTDAKIALFSVKGQNNGILIFNIHNGVFNVLNLFLTNFNTEFRAALSEIIQLADQYNTDSVSIAFGCADGMVLKSLKKNHFSMRDKRNIFIYQNSTKASGIFNEQNWLLFEGDVDL
ncbi:hypothetical protein C4565_10495 [Candidatus Parcubacteria bacterium]|nr:MAG: hypothetical protein C4565_10495 [Candidatus Parcubacteria bacterium]